MLQHPAITRLRATGCAAPVALRALRCCLCGGALEAGDSYYPIAGEIFCPECLEERRREVTI